VEDDKEARKENAMDQTCTNEFADLLKYRVIQKTLISLPDGKAIHWKVKRRPVRQ